MAGQLAALLALFFALGDQAPGVTAAEAAGPADQMLGAKAYSVPLDLTTIFGVTAILLLVGANLYLLRRPISADHADHAQSDGGATDPAEIKAHEEPEMASASSHRHDIRFELERQCQQLADIADRSQRACSEVVASNRSKNARLASLSHDLRTPLNAVIGFSDLMRREMFGPLGHSKYQEYAEHIGDSGHDLLSAVDDIFELTSEEINDFPRNGTDGEKVRGSFHNPGPDGDPLKHELEGID